MSQNNTHSGENCLKCKETVGKMLDKIYNKTDANHKFTIGVKPKDFKQSKYYSELKSIFTALQNYRGHKNFIRSKNLSPCDFFVSNSPFIIEFDESQHFTEPRKRALEMYPKKLRIGFDKEKWVERCKSLNRKDNDPPFRDEQRAWYDTLRDFLPTMKPLKPTKRIYWGDDIWCNLNPDNQSDIDDFKRILNNGTDSCNLSFHIDSNPDLGRIVIARDWKGKQSEVKSLLSHIVDMWPRNYKVKCITTCGGFVQFDWPKDITRSEISDSWNPNDAIVKNLVDCAKKNLNTILTKNLKRRLSRITDYISIGIDSKKEKISTTDNYIGELHIELVFLYDLINDQIYWTGKSYPTTNQENGLVRITDLKSHFVSLANLGKVMLLGCHDLTVFNPRSQNSKGRRKKINDAYVKIAIDEKPDVILHHPHTADSQMTWITGWNFIKRKLPNTILYLGSGRYYRAEGERSDLQKVLESTKHGNTIDCIVRN